VKRFSRVSLQKDKIKLQLLQKREAEPVDHILRESRIVASAF
jgi:hypothetical protein